MDKKHLPKGCYLELVFLTILWIIAVRIFLPWEAIPYVFEEFLFFKGTFWEILQTSWPLFVIGIVLNIFLMTSSVNPPEVHSNAHTIPVTGFFQSLVAGIFEEITFRWVLLYGFMALFWVINRLLISWVDQAILETFVATTPIEWFVGFVTHWTVEVVQHPGAWTIAYAVLASNWKFQQGHLYLGIHGAVFSFIGGLYFFKLTFAHGLFAAMAVHFAFDLMVFIMLLIDIWIEKLMGHHQPQAKIYQWY